MPEWRAARNQRIGMTDLPPIGQAISPDKGGFSSNERCHKLLCIWVLEDPQKVISIEILDLALSFDFFIDLHCVLEQLHAVTTKGNVRAYVHFRQPVPAGIERLRFWPVAEFESLLPPEFHNPKPD